MKKKDSASNLNSRSQIEPKPETNDAIMVSRKKTRNFLRGVELDNTKIIDTSLGDLKNGRNSPVIVGNWIEEKEETSSSKA